MFILPPLPYDYDALEPTVSSDTFEFHHGKHHKAYVDTLNTMLAQAGQRPARLEDVIGSASGKLFNQAGQAWNHGFFWESMTPDYAPPSGELAAAIEAAGGMQALRAAFLTEGTGHFGSGWVWISAGQSGAIQIISTHDGDTVAHKGGTPLLVCDLWEHAYYLDYQNNRKGFLEAWFDKAANWAFAERQLAAAKGNGEEYRYPAPV